MPRRYIDNLPDDIQEAIDIIIYQDLLDDEAGEAHPSELENIHLPPPAITLNLGTD